MKKIVRIPSIPFCLALLLALALIFCRYDSAYAETLRRPSVLIIYPFDRLLPFNTLFFSGVSEALEPYDLNMFDILQENLDLNRNSSSEYLDSLAAYYTAKYASRNFDAIITLGGLATDFLLSRCRGLSPRTPLVPVLTAFETYSSENALRRILPVVVDLDLRHTINLILRLQPNLRKIYIVGDRKGEGDFIRHVRQVISEYKTGPEFVFLNVNRYDDLLAAAKVLDPGDAVLFMAYLTDGAGNSYSSQFVASRLAETAACPVYGIMETYIQSGVVGGAMMPFSKEGLAVGDILLRLFGLKPDAPEDEETRLPAAKLVDERAMLRWGLSEDDLPPGYEVVDRSPSLWRDYGRQVSGAITFFFVQSALICGLFIQIRRRRAAEGKLLGTLGALKQKQQELSGAITLQNNALENLREKETTLQSILSTIPVGVLVIDAGSGTVRIANRAATEILGTFPGDMTGTPCPELFRPFIAEQANGFFHNENQPLEDSILLDHGREIHVLKRVDRVSLGGKVHIIGCLLDITEKKLAEQDARKQAEHLVHADKMISLGTMAAGIMHEINNPNNFISLNAPMLKKAWESVRRILDEYAAENGDFLVEKTPYSRARKHIPILINGIVEGSERIRNIVGDMKEFVSQKPFEAKEEVAINSVLKSSLNLLASKLNKSTKYLHVEYGENIPTVAANAQRVEQVLINLILNGAEALTSMEQSLWIRSYYESAQEKVVVEIRDTGQGIQREHLNRIFDPFFTTKREKGGTGLGLAISQKIVEAYGGRIVISSPVGEGTTAVLTLPAVNESSRSDS